MKYEHIGRCAFIPTEYMLSTSTLLFLPKDISNDAVINSLHILYIQGLNFTLEICHSEIIIIMFNFLITLDMVVRLQLTF